MSIAILEDGNYVQCQNLNCCVIFQKESYLEFLEFWDRLDHSLDDQWEKLGEYGKKLGFDYPDRSELFHLDAVGCSFDSE